MKQKILNFLNFRGILTIFFKVLIDASALMLAYFIAFGLRFDLNIPPKHFFIFKHTIGFAVVIELFFINIFGVNQSQWRYVSLQDTINLLASLVLGWIGFIIYLYFANLLSVPRPALYNQDDLIALRTAAGVHTIKPGITGWAQVNGRDELSIPEKVTYDEYYLHHRSFILNIKILFNTIINWFLHKDVAH